MALSLARNYASMNTFVVHLHPGPNLETSGSGYVVHSRALVDYFMSAVPPTKWGPILAKASDLIELFDNNPLNPVEAALLGALSGLAEPALDMVLIEPTKGAKGLYG